MCLRGSSATEALLDRIQDPSLKVLVVWEPILPTDWERPTNAVLARLHNPNVVQFWDHNHVVAHAIAKELISDPSGPKPHCCGLDRNLWDFVALYPKGSLWQATPPKAIFTDGPVAYVQQSLGRSLSMLLSKADSSSGPLPKAGEGNVSIYGRAARSISGAALSPKVLLRWPNRSTLPGPKTKLPPS